MAEDARTTDLRPAAAALTALLVVLFAITGCAREAPLSPGPEPTAPASSPVDLEPAPPGATEHWDPQPGPDQTVLPPAPAPRWDAASRRSAVQAADAAMTDYAQPRRAYREWWAALQPKLSEQARRDYAHTDPRQIPASRVRGPARLVDTTSAYVAGVLVATDAGPYTVTLSRADARARWLVERITPPDSIGSR